MTPPSATPIPTTHQQAIQQQFDPHAQADALPFEDGHFCTVATRYSARITGQRSKPHCARCAA
ncbi:MAG: hypothetical protein WAQ08_09775 [Aquabacterium sp.]|uniref:hypothetical protein n=1 Tax=Aquabacterium sp. TaxID=1872578 RepID=UPI003BAEAC9C